MAIGDSLRSNLRGALQLGAHLATGPLHSAERRTWGASEAEIRADLPGDELVPDAEWQTTRAVTVFAPPERVWPWIAQIGLGRGGMYSYQMLQDLGGALGRSEDVIRPDLQELHVGDPVRLHPQLPPLRVAQVEPGRTLVLAGLDDPHEAAQDSVLASTLRLDEVAPIPRTVWSYHLSDRGDGCTRLVERNRYAAAGDSLGARLAGGPYVIEPVSFVMSREMLLTIKALAEGVERD